MYPLTVLTGNYSLCTEYHAVFLLVAESAEYSLYLVLSVGDGSFLASACEHFIGVVVMMFVVVIVAAAGAVRTVVVVVLMLVVVVVVMLMLVVVMVVMLMLVVVMVVMLMFIIVIVVMMLMLVVVMVVMLMFIIVIVVVMMMLGFLKKLLQLIIKGVFLRHSVNELLAGKLIPLGRHNGGGSVQFFHDSNSLAYLFL